jgi:hypothetical protein|tara:strand:- start:239 stop:448 length:210 start_codon:yes stop_codon:yes gene_type:complete
MPKPRIEPIPLTRQEKWTLAKGSIDWLHENGTIFEPHDDPFREVLQQVHLHVTALNKLVSALLKETADD